jgi:hypothetical protein
MKKIIFPFSLMMLLFSCSGTSEGTSESENIVELGESYGPVEVDTAKSVSLQEFFTDFEQQDSTGVYTVEGKIVEICQSAGCWVGIDKGNGDYFMVRFKDHFTIPIDTKMGTEAYFHGVARWDSTSVEELRFEAQSAGKSKAEIEAITEPSYSFDFIADGIVLKK